MRQGNEGGEMSSTVWQAFRPSAGLLPGVSRAVSIKHGFRSMKRIAILLAPLPCCTPVFAAITGTVMNGTTGQPQAGITVSVLHMTPQGPQRGGSVKADAQGKFSI